MNKKVLIIGEVLFDRFSNGVKVLGGAPFNVAWSLKGFGLNPLLISRVGDDENGKEIIKTMKNWELDISGIQIDKNHPTGAVNIEMKGNNHTFDILANQAYDFIDFEKINDLILKNDIKLLYNGSLSLRTNKTYNDYFEFKKEINISNFLDVNLRKPWYDIQKIKKLINIANYVKLNNEELIEITGIKNENIDKLAQKFFEKNNFKMLILTKGNNGATIFTKDKILNKPSVKKEKFIDSVGAGDAFSSVVIYGIINNWKLDKILKVALKFSSQICCIKGAVIKDKKFYKIVLK
ncbi:carbohydrate kinase [Candidatus Parcubacteria bacterium]|nr:carbohydrate kinase [Candidatus Parcubacteria bacterium]